MFSAQLQVKLDCGDMMQSQAEDYFAEFHRAFDLYQNLASMSKLRPMQMRFSSKTHDYDEK